MQLAVMKRPFTDKQTALGIQRSIETDIKRRLQGGVYVWRWNKGRRFLVKLTDGVRVAAGKALVIPK